MGMSETVLTNFEAEKAAVGAVMRGATVDLVAADFNAPELRAIYTAVQTMRLERRPVDLVTLDSEMGGSMTEILVELNGIGVPSLAGQYAAIVRESSVRRQAMDLAFSLQRDMSDRSVDVGASLENVRSRLADLGTGKRHIWISAPELAASTMKWLEQMTSGEIKAVTSGIPDMDRTIGGFFPGELTIVGAKPGTGKTVFGMVMALEAAKAGKNVAVLSTEMMDTQFGIRIISNLGGLDSMKLRVGSLDPEDWESVVDAVGQLSRMPAAFTFTTRYIEDIVAAVNERKDIDLLVVDYIQQVQTKMKTETERLKIGHISWALKALAVDKRIPVIAMSQLRRPEQGSDNKMPSMRDLRESGNLEADADGIILLHAPAEAKDPYVHKLDKEGFEAWKEQGLTYIAMKVEKQRQGSTGTVATLFEPKKMRYLGIRR